MGGDGGTLNNSRYEHTRLRRKVFNKEDPASATAQGLLRASTTHCALTKLPLQPPHVVADRLGQLYNKEALLRHILRRATLASERVTGEPDGRAEDECDSRSSEGDHDVLPHIRSVKKDTVAVKLVPAGNGGTGFVCPVTKRLVTSEGSFSLGWNCGCIVSDGTPMEATALDERACLACGVTGTRVRMGMQLHQRKVLREQIQSGRIKKKERKRKRGKKTPRAVPYSCDQDEPANQAS